MGFPHFRKTKIQISQVLTNDLPNIAKRFLEYVKIDTQSDPASDSIPSTEKQKDLSRILVQELLGIGMKDAYMNPEGYVFATLEAFPVEYTGPTVGLIAHLDTSPDEPGHGVEAKIHYAYAGGDIVLSEDGNVILSEEIDPELQNHIGEDVITTDGSTLLGSDDKAGVAIIMQVVEDLFHSDTPRPKIRVCFTIDEEIGKGVEALDLSELSCDVAYTIDGSEIDTVDTENFAAAGAELLVKGHNVHPGYAKGIMINALQIAADFVGRIPRTERPSTTEGRQGYYHPHKFEGDVSVARVKILLRDFEEEGLEMRKSFLIKLREEFLATHSGAEIDLRIEDSYKNMAAYIHDSDPRAVDYLFETAKELGIELTATSIRGGTDGSRLSELGLPTPNIFTGGRQFHSVHEWNTVQNLERAATFVKALMGHWSKNAS